MKSMKKKRKNGTAKSILGQKKWSDGPDRRRRPCELLECEQLPNTQFEMDLVVFSLNKVLYEAPASAAPVPKLGWSRRKKKKKKILPLWNEDVVLVVERSKQVHKEW